MKMEYQALWSNKFECLSSLNHHHQISLVIVIWCVCFSATFMEGIDRDPSFEMA